MNQVILYDYWRSSASYRVRIGLNLKNIDYQSVSVDLLQGEQHSAIHRARNPQKRVPVLEIDDLRLTQSLAILEYLEETRPNPPLLPVNLIHRVAARTVAAAIAMEIHPICNPSVVTHMTELVGGSVLAGEATKKAWIQHFIRQGLVGVEALLVKYKCDYDFILGDQPGLSECFIIPQLYNARRWESDISDLSNLLTLEEKCADISAFAKAHPDAVKYSSLPK